MNRKKNFIKLLMLACFIFLGQHLFAQISTETLQQIELLQNEKNTRTPAQRKIDSRLLQAVREQRGEIMVKGVELDKIIVNSDAQGLLKLDIDADITSAFLAKITALGGKVIFASPEYHTVRVMAKLSTIETIAGYLEEVKFIQTAVKSKVVDAGNNRKLMIADNKPINTPANTNFKTSVSFAQRVANVRTQLTAYLNNQKNQNPLSPLIGSVTSQGDVDHRAADVRSTYGFTGAGIKIGVLSDSYNAKSGAATDVTKGDLPGTGNPDGYTTPVTVVADDASGADEGRAMLQVIHDLAPGAILYFATADVSEAGFASNIKALRNTYNCNIILDDVGYFDEPVFQDGIVAQAVDAVTASGALYFSAAGNSGSLKNGTSGVFEGDFNDAGSAAFSGSTKAGTIHNFGTTASPVNGDILKTAGDVYTLNWSDPIGASSNDYDLFLVSSAGKVKASSTNVQSGTQNPYESISPLTLASGDRLVVFKTTGAAVRAFHLNDDGGTMTVVTNGQTSGHPCAVAAFCMAATPAATAFTTGYPSGPYPSAFVSTNKVEPFSSDGPRKIFYNPDGSAITAGNFLFGTSGGTTLSKPDLTAADGVSTTLAASSGLNPFFGTSCAAPHAGAIAALILSGNPSLTPAQVRTILTSSALDIEGAGYDINSGYGIMQAFQAASQVGTACSAPAGLAASSVSNTSENITWTAVSGATGYTLQWKLSSASTWTTVTGLTTNSYSLTGLTAGTAYQVQVATTCSATSSSLYSTAVSFTTSGTAPCNTPTGMGTASITSSSATFSWTAVTGAASYNIQYRIVGASTWSTGTSTTASYAASGLTLNSNYEWQVQTACTGGGTSSFTASTTFTTTGLTYCTSVGGKVDGITNVTFNTINNTTSATTIGYTDYTATQSTTVTTGSAYTLSVKLNTGGNYTNYAKVWIDWNHDGTFSTTTEEYNLGTAKNVTSGATTLSPLTITVPAGAVIGTTRMRVSTQYNAAPSPCTASFDGEVEDYSVVVAAGSSCVTPSGLAASAITNTTATASWTAVSGSTGYTLQWKLSSASTWTTVTGLTTTSYNLTSLTAGTAYQVQVANVCSATSSSAYSSAVSFTTTGGTITYCASSGSTTYEYIKTVVLNSINHTVTNDGGYGNYTTTSTGLTAGTAYTIKLTPGFASSSYKEYWAVYIDYNQDGVLNGTGETVATGSTSSTTALSVSFTVPTTAKNGATRIRVQMGYGSQPTNPCATLSSGGDVHDYTVNISGGSTSQITNAIVAPVIDEATSLKIWPNPTSGASTNISYKLVKDGQVSVKVVDIAGRNVQTISLGKQAAGYHTYIVNDLKQLKNGNYIIVLYQDNQVVGRNKVIVLN